LDLNFFQQYDIWGFTPEYFQGMGEVTRIIVPEGQDQILSMTMRSFRNNLCRFYSIDYYSLRRKYGQIIGSVNCVPLPISSTKVFIQLKVRTPRFRNDSAMGYLDMVSIAQLREARDNRKTEIVLKDGRKLEVLCSMATVKKHIKNARLVLEHYRNEKGLTAYPEVLERLYSNLDKPATKGDIVILAREILTIKNSLKAHENRL
jgi:hypothetical protein